MTSRYTLQTGMYSTPDGTSGYVYLVDNDPGSPHQVKSISLRFDDSTTMQDLELSLIHI